MKKRRFFPLLDADMGSTGGTGNANSDMQELDNLLNGMGTAGTAGADTTSTAATGTTGAGTAANDAGDAGSTGQATDDQTQTQQTNKQDKAGYAFAEMRSQNSQLFGLLSKVAQAAGIEFKDNNDLVAKLNDDALNKIAKSSNVPVEMLKRFEQLEQTSKLYEANQLKENALAGFKQVQATYGLTDDEVRAFARELGEAGKNPFLAQVDIEQEYKLKHFDEIQQKKIQAAVEEALKRSNAADQHSSTPNNASGKPDSGAGQKISNINELNALLSEMK
jgi:hypothetical protein